MLLAGDEMGRTQRGNNNAYCQDSEISWISWPPGTTAETDQALLEFVGKLIRIRADHPVFRRRRFFRGQPVGDVSDQLRDIVWFTRAGEEMTGGDWEAGMAKTLTVFLNGDAISEPDGRGEPIRDSSFLLLFNAGGQDLEFTVPPARYGARWEKEVDTVVPLNLAEPASPAKPGDAVVVSSRSVQVLSRA